ncbi:MAG: hypothetical protein J0H06_12310, partial [Actinobacteria bacterium]|nr:hypothetical protein [Actinomycetota bacterium]
DMGLPVPTRLSRAGGLPSPLIDARIEALSDQHGHVLLDPAADVQVGDLIGSSISHPCTAFDKWRVIPVVTDDYRVCDAVMTFF